MNSLFGVDWADLFSLSLPLAEIMIRGTAIYWFLFLIFRFVVRRDIGSVGIADILILVIVADASQNAMAGEGDSIADGFVLVATLIFWNVLLDFLSYRFAAFRRFSEPAPLCLVKRGEMIRRNMRRELITEDELMQKLREQGIESMQQVKHVYLESNGAFSVVKYPQ
jgi:uncharacterized membrane protein YcaP (DUF421 family)